MKELIKQYLDHGLSRRQLISGLSALGMSARRRQGSGAKSRADGPGRAPAAAAAATGAIREVEGNGGALFVEQLKAAGVEYIFFNPSTGDHPIFDALVDVPGHPSDQGHSGRRRGRHGGRLCARLEARPASSSSPISACPTP